MQLNLQPVFWTRQFNGQSPGDLENKKNGFAGRFMGFDKSLTSPCDKLPSDLPIILIVGDSIIGDVSISNIREKFRGIANVNFLQQPHHCKNIESWLEEWKTDEWTQYYCICWFDGMRGFPDRVTELEHKELTPILVNRLQKNTQRILWCNCTPIPHDMPQGQTNSVRGPNSKQQHLTNESVVNRNESIREEMTSLNVHLLDLYEKMKPIQHLVQRPKDIHFFPKGEIIMSNHICKRIKELWFNIQNIHDSNNELTNLIQRNKPFSVVRLGIGPETYITYEFILTKEINEKYLNSSVNLNGIYSTTNDISKFESFCEHYHNAIQNADVMASFVTTIQDIQSFFVKKYCLPQIHSRALEPFYVLQDGEIPWTHYLKDKTVLVINPFTDSFERQISNKFQMFRNKSIFLEDQTFLFYKSYQTIAGNHIHNDWLETFTIMCNDIKDLNFDIALLGCGGYGLPLCDFIKTKLNKSAIYVGGGLQLMFGVMGKRWENIPMWKQIIHTEGCKFIRPSDSETCSNHNSVDGGSYW